MPRKSQLEIRIEKRIEVLGKDLVCLQDEIAYRASEVDAKASELLRCVSPIPVVMEILGQAMPARRVWWPRPARPGASSSSPF